MAFGQNIEEIVLQVRAEGKGEADAMRQEVAKLRAEIEGFFAAIAKGDDVTKNTQAISRVAGQIKLIESALVQIDPAYQKTIQTQRDVATAYAKSAQEQAEATARTLAAERAAAAERENIARLRMAMEKHDADERKRISKAEQVELDYDLNRDNERLQRQTRNLEQGRDSATKFGYGLLNIAHLVQDAQYGFGAVLNNIPLVVQALGGNAGLAGTVMIAGVGVSVFGDHIKQLGREMGLLRDPANDATSTVEQLKEKIAALVEKPWKLDIDFRSIREGQKELDILEARFKALDAAMKKQTSLQQKSGAAVLGVVTEMGGAEGELGGAANLEKIVREVADTTGLTDIFMGNDRRSVELKELRRQAELGMTPGAPASAVAVGAASQKRADALEAQMREDARMNAAGATVGSALRGNQQGVDDLLMMLGSPEGQRLLGGDQKLGIEPVDPGLLRGLRGASPKEIKANEELNARLEAEQKRNLAVYEAGVEAEEERNAEETRALIIQGKVGEAAFDAAQDIKNKMGAQVKPEKPKRLDPVSVSPYVRRQQFLARRRQGMRASGMEDKDAIVEEVGDANPGLNQQQVMNVAGMANRLMGQGWSKVAALNEAMLRLNMEMMQNMRLLQARQQGFMGTVGQLRQQNRRMMQPGTSLMPNPFPQFGSGR